MVVGNNSNVSSGWQVMGNWTVSGPPATVSVTPASGTGTAQVFTFVYSDPVGFADISYVDVLFQSGLFGQNACYVVYLRAANSINLFNDAATAYAGSATLGAAAMLTNSQCTLNSGASSISVSGNNLTLALALTFNPGFNGAKNIYMVAGNNSGLSSGWQTKGVWTPQ
jgi:hypothetical protein